MVSRAGRRRLLRGQPSHPCRGGGALLRAGDRIHTIPAAVLSAGRRRPGDAGTGGSDPGAGARRHRFPRPAGRSHAELPAGPPAVRGAPAHAQRAARRDRRHARRCCHPGGRAAAQRAHARGDPLRPALQRGELVAGGNVLPVLRPPRDVLGCLRRYHTAARADGHVPPARLPARAVRERAGVPRGRARSDGPGPRTEPTPPDGNFSPRVEREGSGLDGRVVPVAGRAGSVTSLLRVSVLRRSRRDRRAGRLPVGDAGPAERVKADTQVRPLPDGGALRRLPGGRGAGGPGAAEAAGEHGGDRDVGSRDGVRRERAGIHGARDGVQRVPDAHAPGDALAGEGAGARGTAHLPQRRGADAGGEAVRLHESAGGLREWAGSLRGWAVGVADRRELRGLCVDRAGAGDHRVPGGVRDPGPGLSARRPPDDTPRGRAGRAARDEPVLPIMAGLPGRRRPVGLGGPALPLLGLLVFLGPIVPSVSAEKAGGNRVHVTTNRLDLLFSLDGASPVTWRACHPSCAQADAAAGTSMRFTGNDDSPQARLVLHGPGPAVDLQGLRFTADLSEDTRAQIVTFRSDLPVDGVRLVKSFAVSREGYEVVMTARLLGPNAAAFMAGRRLDLELDAGRGLFPAPAAGFAAILERVSRVVVGEGGVRVVPDDRREPLALRAGDWTGFRSRFWAMLQRSDGAGVLGPRSATSIAVVPADEPGRLSWRYTLYSGPLEKDALTHADPALEQMLFSGLWSWLRPLSFALLFLLRGLTAIADRLQTQVNAVQARLQPGIDAINAAHKGEERARRTLALYREAGVHPLYTLKSLLGFLIQLPVFIAVFDMLAEDIDLYRAPFLWIPDLSRPDALAALPACVPFFGCALNLLPFLMSGVSLATTLRFRSPVLTPALVRRQRRNLMVMTLLFFLLFYTFPAGMVLYWTSKNFFQLVSQELKRLRPDR